MINYLKLLLSLLLIGACAGKKEVPEAQAPSPDLPYLVVLGVAQDAGYPQTGCYQLHCMRAWENPEYRRKVVSLGLVDPRTKKKWLFEATPDIKDQLYELNKLAPDSIFSFDGVFMSHGHMGHYTGLMQLGFEAMNIKNLKAFVMPRMLNYFKNDGPWSQLVDYENISLEPIQDSVMVSLTNDISVVPFIIPHRDEYTEAVGLQVFANGKSLVFIPDIDKWHHWDVNLAEIHEVWDYAFVDASFYKDGELPGRDMSKIMHPFVSESFDYFGSIPADKKAGVHFIHFNHTNPLLIEGSNAQREVREKGFNFAYEGQILVLE